ncbi:MAG: hypothetical protein RL563_227 [Pseudomonadota bacterium]|jgi:uncharacterized protein (DUF4415 family)
MNPQSKTDWARVKRDAEQEIPIAFDPAEDPYDPNDTAAVETFWEGAQIEQGDAVIGKVKVRGKGKRPTKKQVAIRYDADVLAAFKATGKGWQTRMNDALKEWLERHEAV